MIVINWTDIVGLIILGAGVTIVLVARLIAWIGGEK